VEKDWSRGGKWWEGELYSQEKRIESPLIMSTPKRSTNLRGAKFNPHGTKDEDGLQKNAYAGGGGLRERVE